ncbi:MAG: hypothetical protein RLZZ338_3193, partial [Cyanobacteriota bacterium]
GGFLEVICSWEKFGLTRPYRDNRVGMGRFFVLTVLAGAILTQALACDKPDAYPTLVNQSLTETGFLSQSMFRFLIQYITNNENKAIPVKYFNILGTPGLGEKKPSIQPAMINIGTIPKTNRAALVP